MTSFKFPLSFRGRVSTSSDDSIGSGGSDGSCGGGGDSGSDVFNKPFYGPRFEPYGDSTVEPYGFLDGY
ncbi:hypothetical protein HZH68_009842 [Vespula germanica]|uniref:Uncharacterized protein n=1 Tax=Vespula germanica TaxID=30212 RepID=A0A834N4C1_VESGE|nr:hypothetical protein HZH68_009842 [Vespula germanica]